MNGRSHRRRPGRPPDDLKLNAAKIEKHGKCADAIANSMLPQEIGRVLINLLNNAFYAVRERATHINGQYIPMVSVQAVQRVDAIAVQATGDGPGIPDAVRACIFEPFFTTKPTGSGTGLALSMSYDIIT